MIGGRSENFSMDSTYGSVPDPGPNRSREVADGEFDAQSVGSLKSDLTSAGRN